MYAIKSILENKSAGTEGRLFEINLTGIYSNKLLGCVRRHLLPQGMPFDIQRIFNYLVREKSLTSLQKHGRHWQNYIFTPNIFHVYTTSAPLFPDYCYIMGVWIWQNNWKFVGHEHKAQRFPPPLLVAGMDDNNANLFTGKSTSVFYLFQFLRLCVCVCALSFIMLIMIITVSHMFKLSGSGSFNSRDKDVTWLG